MRKPIFFFTTLAVLSGLVLAFSSPARADDDPPGRVARLNYIQGSISFQPGGQTDWVQANPNRPLTIGDNLWADKESRGELHIGSTSIRMGSETGITFLNLDDRTVQIQLAEGTLSVHVRRLEGGDAFEIDTPNLAFTLARAGEYRFDVDPDGGATTITVREGEGDATGGGSEYHMDTGDRATFTGTDSLTYDGGQAGGFDDFDEWTHSRDEREDSSASARYVSRDVIGYDDLDGYGQWQNVPDYGYVWFPAGVAPGWAPYRFGHWVFIAPWGWTWVEDEPWGFAPFHYGRWAVFGGAWCWVPGPVVVRPVYAPALVVFVGGPRFGASVAFGGGGGMAWFPLGPREVYVPPYRTSARYVQNVNVTNTRVTVVNVTNVYNNVTVNNTTVNRITYMHQNNVAAVTAVSHDTFVNARPVATSTVRVNAQQIQAAQVQRNFAVAPVQKSVVGAARTASVRPPQTVMERQVVVKQPPAIPHAAVRMNTQGTFTQQGHGPVPQTLQQPPVARQQTQGPRSFEPPKGQPQNQAPQSMSTRPQSPAVQQTPQPQFKQATGQPGGQPNAQPSAVRGPANTTPQGRSNAMTQGTQSHPNVAAPVQQGPQPQFKQATGQPGGQPNGKTGTLSGPANAIPQQRTNTIQGAQERTNTAPGMPGRPNTTPPVQQTPNVRFAPPPQANEHTYQPHQFERPPAPATNANPPREPTKQQESRKPDNDKQRK